MISWSTDGGRREMGRNMGKEGRGQPVEKSQPKRRDGETHGKGETKEWN